MFCQNYPGASKLNAEILSLALRVGHHAETQREAAENVIQERFEMDQKIPVRVGAFARLLGNNVIEFV